MKTIISAMENEVKLLLEEAEIYHVDTIGGVDYNVGKLHGENVVIAQAGIGKALAACRYTNKQNKDGRINWTY